MINDPRLASIPDTHGHAKGEHKPFAEERPIPYSARMLFLWFYHACKRGFPRFLMVADHINYLTFEDPTAVHMVRRAIKLAEAGDLYGAAETASVDVAHAKVVHEGLTRRGMRYSIGAEVDNDPRSRPDAQNIVDAMKPDAMVRSIHFLPVDHPQFGANWFWPFDNPEFAGVFDIVGIERTWELYMAQLLEAIEKLPGHIIGHFYVPAKFGHWPDEAALEGYEDRFVAACAEHGKAIEINARLFYRPVESPELLDAYRAANLRLLRKAKAAGVGIAVGSDAHSPRDQGRGFDEVLALLDEAAVNELVFPIAGRLRQVALRATREMLDGAFPPLTATGDGASALPPSESDDETDGAATAETPEAAAGAGASPAAASRPKPRRASPKREPGKSSKRTTPSPAKPAETDSLPGAVEPDLALEEPAADDAPAAELEDQPAVAAPGETAPEAELEEIVKAVALDHDPGTASPETLAPDESTLDDPALHLNDAQRLLAASAAGNAARAAEPIAGEPATDQLPGEAATANAEAATPNAEAEQPSDEAATPDVSGDGVAPADMNDGIAAAGVAEPSTASKRVRPSRAATRSRTTKAAETAAPAPPAPKTGSRSRAESVATAAKPPAAKPAAAATKPPKAGSRPAKASAAKTASAAAKPAARAASASSGKAAAKKKTTAARPAVKAPARKATAAPARSSGAAKKVAAKPAAAKRPARPAAPVAKKAPAKKTAAKKKPAKPRR